MNRVILFLCCQLALMPLPVFANAWNDLAGSSGPGPTPIPGCGEQKFCMEQTNESNSDQNAFGPDAISALDLEDNSDVRKLNSVVLTSDKTQQFAALKKFTQKPEAASISTLQIATRVKDIEVRRMSMYLLGKIHSRESAAVLHGLLNNQSSPNDLKVYAAKLLGEAGHQDAIPDLHKSLRQNHQDLSIESAIALAKLNDHSGIATLYHTSQSNELGEGVRENAILALEILTGQKFAYTSEHFAPVTARQKKAAQAHIKAWWIANHEAWLAKGGVK